MTVTVRGAMVAVILAGACGGEPPPWQLTWQDEFDGPAGPPDAAKWGAVTGGGGWGNGELQHYTARPENVARDGAGQLVITARAERFSGNDFTSARLTSKAKFAQRYGRFEARLRLPAGRGLWPAFWLLGDDIDEVGWPDCGEIDVVEQRGHQPWRVSSAAHGPGHHGGNALSETYELADGTPLTTDFHLYAVEWDATELRFFVDATPYHTVRRSRLRPGARWAYDHPFFLLLNLAVGGHFGGPPDATTPFPSSLLADYVRVYAR